MPTTSTGAAHSGCLQQEAQTPVHMQRVTGIAAYQAGQFHCAQGKQSAADCKSAVTLAVPILASKSLPEGTMSCCADQKIALLGAMQSLFEGSMYTFVFLWTPALSPAGEHLPHGMIFACFMVSSSLVTQRKCEMLMYLGRGKLAIYYTPAACQLGPNLRSAKLGPLRHYWGFERGSPGAGQANYLYGYSLLSKS